MCVYEMRVIMYCVFLCACVCWSKNFLEVLMWENNTGFQASLTILYVQFCVCIEADSLFREVVMWENNTGFEVSRGVPQTVDSLVMMAAAEFFWMRACVENVQSVDKCRTAIYRHTKGGKIQRFAARLLSELLPPYQKEGYTLLRKLYLKTPDDYRDSNCTIQNQTPIPINRCRHCIYFIGIIVIEKTDES